MHFTTAILVLMQAAEPVDGSPETAEQMIGVELPFELVAIVVGVLVTFGLVYLVRRAFHEGEEF